MNNSTRGKTMKSTVKTGVPEQFEVMVRDSGLEITKAQTVLDTFQKYFVIAAEWEEKAKSINVTDASQIPAIQEATAGFKIVQSMRIALEKDRKTLKEQALREGKFIDGMANVLKGLIAPTEEHLKAQKDFVKIKEEREAEERRIAGERLLREKEEREVAEAEKTRLEQEEAGRKEQERIRKENERLRKEAEEKEIARLAELKKQESRIATERMKARKELEEIERKAAVEKEKADKILYDERAKSRAKAQAAEEKRCKEIEEEQKERDLIQAEANLKALKEKEKACKEQKERERLQAILDSQITCPKCGHKFNKGE